MTPVHYPISSSLFQPYSSTSRTSSLHGLPTTRPWSSRDPDHVSFLPHSRTIVPFLFFYFSLHLVILRSEICHELTSKSTNRDLPDGGGTDSAVFAESDVFMWVLLVWSPSLPLPRETVGFLVLPHSEPSIFTHGQLQLQVPLKKILTEP